MESQSRIRESRAKVTVTVINARVTIGWLGCGVRNWLVWIRVGFRGRVGFGVRVGFRGKVGWM